MDYCDACDFTYGDYLGPVALESITSTAEQFRQRLSTRPIDLLQQRSSADVWSAIEYACHVRDVMLTQRERLFLVMIEDIPTFAPMHREERVALEMFQFRDPSRIAGQLVAASELLTDTFRCLTEPAWQREMIYNYPTPTRRSVAWFAAHTLHEEIHHLADIDSVLAQLSA